MNTSQIFSRTLAALGAGLVLACTSTEDARKVDPNLPAVVQAPPLVLPGDTMRTDTVPAYRERMAVAIGEIYREYGVLQAAAVLGDRRMLAAIYSTDATLRIGDSTYTGSVSLVNAMAGFFSRASVTDMTRQSRAINAVDSVYTDSGSYVMVSKRAGGRETSEQGTYVSKWRLRPTSPRWVLQHDELTPAAAKKR